ncbi:MAG: hypothetical protein JRJ68_13410 [Deltaproteobacteria bacterium]|nr:hypothetical protein [Deltaproteobacteria bacterium]
MEQTFDLLLPPAAANLDIFKIIDVHKLLRLHPHWFVENEEMRDSVLSATLRDYATDKVFSLGIKLDTIPVQDDEADVRLILRISLFDYGANELLFFVQDNQTKVRVRYDEGQADEALEQDMLLWVRAIQEYLRLYTAATPYTLFFRLLMNRMILQMNPSQRKICLMLTKITVVELLVIVAIIIGYVSFGQ